MWCFSSQWSNTLSSTTIFYIFSQPDFTVRWIACSVTFAIQLDECLWTRNYWTGGCRFLLELWFGYYMDCSQHKVTQHLILLLLNSVYMVISKFIKLLPDVLKFAAVHPLGKSVLLSLLMILLFVRIVIIYF